MKATFSNHVLTAHTCHAGCVLTLDGCHYVANRPGLIRHLDGLLAFPPPPQPHAPHASLPVDPQVKAAIVCGPPTQGSPGTHFGWLCGDRSRGPQALPALNPGHSGTRKKLGAVGKGVETVLLAGRCPHGNLFVIHVRSFHQTVLPTMQ